MVIKNNNKTSLLIVIVIILLLAIVALFSINLKKSSPSSQSSPSSSTGQSPSIPSDRFQGKLACLPPDKTPPCTYGLFFEKNYYRFSGLSQTVLTDAGFSIDDQVTVLGQANQDTIEVSSISAN